MSLSKKVAEHETILSSAALTSNVVLVRMLLAL